MTKTEMAEFWQDRLDEMLLEHLDVDRAFDTLFDREFKDLFDDFKVKLQERIEESIEQEEQEIVEEDADIGISMEGE